MGRVDAVGADLWSRASIRPLDLFRYSAPGRSRDLGQRPRRPISPSTMAPQISGTILQSLDYADWNYSLVRGDAFGASLCRARLSR